MSRRLLLRRRPLLQPLEARDVPAVPSSWSVRGAGGGGALFSPSFGLTDPDEIYVASDMSNLFRTTNGGTSWVTSNHTEIQGNHYAKVNFTNDPNVRYCLDYSNVNLADLIRPSKSTDGGATWTPLAGDPTGGGAFNLFADPNNANRVIVSDYTRLFFSSNGGASFSLEYTTTNTGAGLHLAGAFFDGNTIYVGTNAGLLVSTDGGANFAVAGVGGIPAGEALVSFSGAKQGATTRLFGVTLNAGDVYAGITGADFSGYQGVYTVDAGAANWVERVTGIPAGVYPFFVATSLTDINTAYVAGGSNAGAPIVYKTTNAGGSWSPVFNTVGNANIQTGWSGQGGDRSWGYGEYALGLAVAPTDANRVLITDLGFGHMSINGGTSWQAKYVAPGDLNPAGANTPTGKAYHDAGLDNTTSWGLTWADANTMILSNSDVRGQRSTDGGVTWGFGYTGHTDNSMYRSVKAANGVLYAATSTVHDLYQSTYLQDSRIDGGGGKVLFSTNNGATWQLMRDFNDPVVWVAQDPTNANRLYASVVNRTAGDIYVSNNINLGAAATWTRLATPPRTEGHPFNIRVLNDGTIVASYSGRRTSGGAFTASSGVFVSSNGGASWADRSAAGMQYWTKDVVIDQSDTTQNTWYAGVWSGWGGPPNGLGGLYRTTNRGVNWTRINTLDRVTSITIDPTDNNRAYLTTETNGLWHTTNLQAASPTFTLVSSYPFRQPERVFFNPFNPSEVWVTAFGGGLMVGSTDAAPSVAGTQVNDGSVQRSMVRSLRVTFSETVTLAGGAISLTGPGGNVGYTLDLSQSTPSQTIAILNFASLADGNYTLNLPAASVTDSTGQHLAANYAFTFHRLFGDGDGDRDVDATDFAAFRSAFGTMGLTFDSDGDGDVDASDFAAFRQRFGSSI